MNPLLFVIAVIYTIYVIAKEKFEKPVRRGKVFDWDFYYRELNDNNISYKEVLKRQERGYYYVEKPKENSDK